MSVLQDRYNLLINPVAQKKSSLWGPAEKAEDRTHLVSEAVTLILEEAVKARASDIHCEPIREALRIRYRIDGLLYVVLIIDEPMSSLVIRRLKVLAEIQLEGSSSQASQDGRFKQRMGASEYDFRVASFPTVLGEKIVIRILSSAIAVYTLAKLGLDESSQIRLNQLLQLKSGLFLACGPTGSGKTTSLYALLKEINSPKINVVTLEDPVEYQIEGMNQCDIKTRSKFTFADGLKAVLRQDPDIVLVGEIRDGETANIATRAAITGHLVFSSVHANSAVGTIVRLLNMGVDPYIVSYAMTGVISQRLVRRICIHCRTTYQPSREELDLFNKISAQYETQSGTSIPSSSGSSSILSACDASDEAKVVFYKGTGCPECHMTGYMGRLGLYELLVFNNVLREAILKGCSSMDLQDFAVKGGMQPLAIDALKKVKAGLTSFEEVRPFLIETF